MTTTAQAWNAVIATLQPVNDDDRGMATASADDLFAWCDDLEARVGLDVAQMRAAVLDYVLLRDGTEDPDMQEYLRSLRDAP